MNYLLNPIILNYFLFNLTSLRTVDSALSDDFIKKLVMKIFSNRTNTIFTDDINENIINKNIKKIINLLIKYSKWVIRVITVLV